MPREKKNKNKYDFEKHGRTVFVGNLASSMTQKDISRIFKDCGEVESARIRSVIPEKETLAPKVAAITKKMHSKVDTFNAYVVFAQSEQIETVIKKALALNGCEIEGHRIRVDRASAPKAKRQTITSRKKSVFVGNLKFDTRDDDLIKFFETKVGPVKSVRIVRDSQTGFGKGFGFVCFNERPLVKKALELKDTKFLGRDIRLTKVNDVGKGAMKKE